MGAGVLGDVRDPLLRPARPPGGVRPAARRGVAAARKLALLVAVAAGLALQAGAADADTVDRAQYVGRLNEARTALARARAAGPAERAALVERARDLLRLTTAVRLSDGQAVRIDDAALAQRIDASDARLDAAIADLGALADIARSTSPLDVPAAEARLRQMAGEQLALGGQVSLIDAVSRWLARTLAGFGGAPPDTRVVVIAAGGIGLALLVLVIAILGRDLRERFRREIVLPELASDERVDPGLHWRAAEEAIRAGRARDAIVALYAYALAALAAREMVVYDPSLTDRELLARAATIPHADALRDLVDLHERVSYGLRDARMDDAERARALAMRAVA